MLDLVVMVFPPANKSWEQERAALALRLRRAELVLKLGVPIVVASVVAFVGVVSYAPHRTGLAQGLLYLLAVVGTVITGTAMGRSDHRRRAMWVHDALTEIAENLVEVALAYDADERAFRRFPNLCLAKVNILLSHAGLISAGLYAVIEHIDPKVARDAESLLRVHRRVAGSEEPQDAKEGLEDFVETSLRFVLEVGRRYPLESAAALEFPGFEDLRRCLDHGARVAFYSSEAEQQSDLGAQRPPVVCWVDDCAPDGVMVLPQFEKFGKLVG